MKLFHALLLTALCAGQTFATPVGSGFTYQGKLNDGGVPANGNYDMIFNLYDAPTNGNVLGTFSIFGAVPVSNGLFTVELNAYHEFGTNAFNGEARWLQIGVRTNNNNAANNFIYLNPRQALNCAPQAMFAQSASNAASAGVAATVADGSITSSKLAPGAVTWSSITGIPAGLADGVDSDSTYTAGPGLTLSGANQFSANFGGSGSANTVARSDHHHYGAAWAGNTSFGIGLSVTNSSANSATGLYGQQGSGSGFPYIFGNTAGVWGESSQGSGVYGATAYTNGNGVFGLAVATNGANHGVQGLTISTSGSGVFGSAMATNGNTTGVSGQSASTSGVGVRGLASAATGPGLGVRGETKSSGGYGVAGYASSLAGAPTGVYGESSAVNGAGLVGRSTFVSGVGPNYGVIGQSDSLWGYGVYGHAASPSGINYGVVGEAHSAGGCGVVARNNNGVALKVEGTGVVQSDADSIVFIPGCAGFGEYDDGGVTRGAFGLTVNNHNLGDNDVGFALTLPGVQYGQNTILKSVEIFYSLEDPDNGFISDTWVSELTAEGVDFSIHDTTPRRSGLRTSYVVPVNRYFRDTGGFFTLELRYSFTLTGGSHYLHIDGIKVRLGHK